MNIRSCFDLGPVLVMRRLAGVGLLLTLASCASWPDKPQFCFRDQAPLSPASAGELKAINYVKKHAAESCRPVGVECSLQLHHTNNEEIEVVALRAFLEGDPPACTHLEGGFKTYVFSPGGKYIRVELGL